jgi:hypothetical protein
VSGVVFPAAQASALLGKVRVAWGQPTELERMGKNARTEFEQKYTEDTNYEMLMRIYEAAIAENKRS